VWNYWWISTILLNSTRSRSESAVYWNFKRKCDDLVILSIEQSYGFECNKDLSVVDTMKNYIARVHITMDFLPLSGASRSWLKSLSLSSCWPWLSSSHENQWAYPPWLWSNPRTDPRQDSQNASFINFQDNLWLFYILCSFVFYTFTIFDLNYT